MSVKEHYDGHLANFYAWMAGDFCERKTEQYRIFQELGISANSAGATAIDLGCGHGLQSVALAELGYKVVAVDFNRQLLNQLAEKSASLKIEIVEAEIIDFLKKVGYKVDLITCMGDTITHLDSVASLHQMFMLIKNKVNADGKVMISFRDLSNELKENSRFIPVKSDDTRILTCFLEYFEEFVKVHDMLWEKQPWGWKQSVSAYKKLRLSASLVTDVVHASGLHIVHSQLYNGMTYMVATHQPIE